MSNRDPKAYTRWFRLDYFRRPRTLRRLYGPILVGVLLLTGAVAAVGVACVVLKPGRSRTAFQAAPVSTAHALVADRCEACHVGEHAFFTAVRLWPGDAHVSSVSDQACLQCHPAAVHNPEQKKFAKDAGTQSANCTQCHHEHRGDAALARLPDAVCTDCHRDLQTRDGVHHFHAHVTSFAADHPAFGAWRQDPGGVPDPGRVHFSHQDHLRLAEKLKGDDPGPSPWRKANIEQAEALEEQSCTYCHKADAQGRYMRPVRYDEVCAKCHPLLPQLRPGAWPPDDAQAMKFMQTPLHHPGPGQDARVVRGELLDRVSRLVIDHPPGSPPPTDDEIRPFVLNRPFPPLDGAGRRTVGQVVHAEHSLFAPDPNRSPPLPGFETLADFNVKTGCAFCHAEKGRSDDGLPVYLAPRSDDGGRRFPNARFDHNAHRMMTCADCHGGKDRSMEKDTLLMPEIQDCRRCHGGATSAARSDCLECHGYHGHDGGRPLQNDPPAVQALLQSTP